MLSVAPTSVLADAQVRGTPETLTVSIENSSVAEILVVLSNRFGIRYRSSAHLEKRLSGTYTGSLQQVIARVLDGYNFFTKVDEEGVLDVTVLGTSAASQTAQPPVSGASRITSSSERGKAAEALTMPTPAPALPGSGLPAIPEDSGRNGPLPAPPVPSGPGSAPIPIPGERGQSASVRGSAVQDSGRTEAPGSGPPAESESNILRPEAGR